MNHKTRFSRAVIVATTGLSIALRSGAAKAECSPAHVWASPRVVNYGTVIRDAEENPTEPNLTVFIELADGSLADPSSITLNGLPALPEPSAEGDANGNAIADLMVKFNRSALLTTDGLLRIAGTTASGGCFTGETHVEIRCLPEAVERSDYFIDFTTSDMPDPQFNGLPAQLDVHRVKPVFPRG